MNARLLSFSACLAALVFGGCATQETELTQKQRDKLDREQARMEQKQRQAQDKAMRDSTQGNRSKSTR